MRAALHDGTTVVNLIEYDPANDYTPPDGLILDQLPDGSAVYIGQQIDPAGGYVWPPVRSLTSDVDTVPAGGTALVTYTDTYDDAPAEVTFDANGATATVALTDGIAELEVTVPEGLVTVTAVGRDVPPVTIRGV